MLPEHRTRQPRTLPSVTPEDARVVYAWPTAEPTHEQRSTLEALLLRVVRIGHSSSLVVMRILDVPDSPQWVPAVDGPITLRVVEKGQLAALEQIGRAHV